MYYISIKNNLKNYKHFHENIKNKKVIALKINAFYKAILTAILVINLDINF